MWGISSAVEHFVDIEGVTSSILVSPTTLLRRQGHRPQGNKNRRTLCAKLQPGAASRHET